MVEKINRILVILIVAACCAYWYYLNPGPTTLRYSNTGEITAPLAVLLLATFAIGVIAMMILAIYFGTKSYFRERSYKARERRNLQFYEQLLEARAAQAVSDRGVAQSRWEALLRKDPTNVLARVELARSIKESGNLDQALQLLDEGRTLNSNNSELLLLAAEINAARGNMTAALDNLRILFQSSPTQKIARLARDSARSLAKYDDAIQFHEVATQFSSNADEERIGNELQFEKLMNDTKDESSNAGETTSKTIAALEKLAKRYPSVAAYRKLAEFEASRGDLEYSSTLLGKAAQLGNDIELASQAVQQALESSGPDRAIALQRTFVDKFSGLPKTEARLQLIDLYLQLQMYSEARKELDTVERECADGAVTLSEVATQEIVRLNALWALTSGDNTRAIKILRKQESQDGHDFDSSPNNNGLPDPALSTP